jgi:hypothetical protein
MSLLRSVKLDDQGVSQGGQDKVLTSDTTLAELMEQVLIELKKLNVHLESISDLQVNQEDME